LKDEYVSSYIQLGSIGICPGHTFDAIIFGLPCIEKGEEDHFHLSGARV
jgi:hypothetical protein